MPAVSSQTRSASSSATSHAAVECRHGRLCAGRYAMDPWGTSAATFLSDVFGHTHDGRLRLIQTCSCLRAFGSKRSIADGPLPKAKKLKKSRANYD